jgi:phospholipid-binding lipoprotein MlaA
MATDRVGTGWRLALAAALLAVAGCASTGGGGAGAGNDVDEGERAARVDPFEPLNRSIYAFNDAVDQAVLKPAAKGYEAVVPRPFRDMVGNFFGNLGDLWTAANQMLQGKPAEAFSDLSRFVVNTTFGFGGIADVASEMGIEKHDEDFGQTLGVWGVPSGPYLVLPLLGPSSFRDAPARALDMVADPLNEIGSRGQANNLWLTRLIDGRARLFPAERVLEGAALDKYSFTRDAWLQRRRNQIHDGNPPADYDEED